MSNEIQQVPTSQIRPGDNDRTTFNQVALQELADSIAANGLAQPITVRGMWECQDCNHTFAAVGDKTLGVHYCPQCACTAWSVFYQIVAGERRFRACSQILAWETIPSIVRELNDE